MTNVKFIHQFNTKKPNRGWVFHKISAQLNDKEIGYLDISYIPLENYRNLYKCPIDYLTKVGGWAYKNNEQSILDAPLTHDQVKSWTWSYYYDNNLQNKINNYSQEQLKFLVKRMNKQLFRTRKRQIQRFKEYQVNTPYVDYIIVDNLFRQQGIGTKLYVEGSKLAAKFGLKLRASSLQSDSAKICWEKMAAKGWVTNENGKRYLTPNLTCTLE